MKIIDFYFPLFYYCLRTSAGVDITFDYPRDFRGFFIQVSKHSEEIILSFSCKAVVNFFIEMFCLKSDHKEALREINRFWHKLETLGTFLFLSYQYIY